MHLLTTCLHAHVHAKDLMSPLAPSATAPAHSSSPAVLPPATVHESTRQLVTNVQTVATVPETGPRPRIEPPDHCPGRARLTSWRCTARDVHAVLTVPFQTERKSETFLRHRRTQYRYVRVLLSTWPPVGLYIVPQQQHTARSSETNPIGKIPTSKAGRTANRFLDAPPGLQSPSCDCDDKTDDKNLIIRGRLL